VIIAVVMKSYFKKLKLIYIRKIFHLGIGAVFVPGISEIPNTLSIFFIFALKAFILVEILRHASFFNFLTDFLHGFTDTRDRAGPVIKTHIYLLLGCGIPLWADMVSSYA
jgi:hypothetical protein